MEFEHSKIDFPCPECSQRFQVSLLQLFPGEVLTCPICGATSAGGELSALNQAFKKVEAELLKMQNIPNDKDNSLKNEC